MKWFAALFACIGIISCQRGGGGTAPPVPEQYRSDIENLCGAVSRSGADRLPTGERALTIASWLAAQLKTPEARAYLVAIQPLVGEPKAAALDAEARRVGLPRCALAEEWRAAAPT